MQDDFNPDWVSPPGDTILDLLLLKLAEDLKCSLNEAQGLLSGETQITPEMAEILSKTLGGSNQFWINRENQYRAGKPKLSALKQAIACSEKEFDLLPCEVSEMTPREYQIFCSLAEAIGRLQFIRDTLKSIPGA